MSAPIGASRVERKVTSSGVIWLQGRSYYVSRRLAGQVIAVEIRQGTLVIDVMVPLHKEYCLPRSRSRTERNDIRRSLAPRVTERTTR